jgi:VanZ family protein
LNPVLRPSLRFSRLWFCLGLLIAAVITVMSLVPPRDVPNLGLSDKFEHSFAYFVLAFWLASVIVRRDFFWLAVSLLAFGGGIEIAQGLMGLGRQADWFDLLADGVGIVVGVLFAMTPLGHWADWLESLVVKRPA